MRLRDLCISGGKADGNNQQLLRNMRVHNVVLAFLSVPHDRKKDSVREP